MICYRKSIVLYNSESGGGGVYLIFLDYLFLLMYIIILCQKI